MYILATNEILYSRYFFNYSVHYRGPIVDQPTKSYATKRSQSTCSTFYLVNKTLYSKSDVEHDFQLATEIFTVSLNNNATPNTIMVNASYVVANTIVVYVVASECHAS